MSAPPEGFGVERRAFRGKARDVLVSQTPGPPVLILHELFGVTDTLVAFCRMIAAGGFRVYAPVLFGSTTPVSNPLAKAARAAQFACVRAEFRHLEDHQSGPWADWLRDLAAAVAAERAAKGVGVIGLCLTGNFALAMAASPKVLAAVMGEPSLPFRSPAGLHVTPEELAAVRARDIVVRGYRYSTDRICPQAKFDALHAALGAQFAGETLPASKRLHSVFTEHLRDEAGQLRHNKVQEVIDHLSAALR